MRKDWLLELSDVASGQWGLFTSAQVRALGVTAQQVARLAHSGVVERLRHGVYRLAGVPDDPRTSLRAAWLALDPARSIGERYGDASPGVVSHHSAAWLHGLGDLDADDLEFSVAERRQSRRRETRFHVRELGPTEWELVDGLPVTTVLTTVDDLARAGTDGGHLAGVVRDALVEAHANFDAVAATLRPYAHRYGAPLGDGYTFLEDLLEEVGVPTSTLSTAAAVSARHVADLNQVLASPTVVENLRYLQSSALLRSLAQLQEFSVHRADMLPAMAAAARSANVPLAAASAGLTADLAGHAALHAPTEQIAAAAIPTDLEAALRAVPSSLEQARGQVDLGSLPVPFGREIDAAARTALDAQAAAARCNVLSGPEGSDPKSANTT